MPPDNVGGSDSQDNGGSPPPGGGYAPQGGGSDDASLLVRVERLEDQIRQMTGEMQQMQFANHQLQDQLKKFQEDVDFRFQERGGHSARHGELTPANPPPAATDADNLPPQSGADADASADSSADSPAGSTPRSRRDDAFDPAAHPDAPGAPKQLGTTGGRPPPVADNGESAASDPNAPLNLPSAQYTPAQAAAPSSGGVPAGGVTTPGGTMIASAQPSTPRQEFDVALGYFKQKDYDSASAALPPSSTRTRSRG